MCIMAFCFVDKSAITAVQNEAIVAQEIDSQEEVYGILNNNQNFNVNYCLPKAFNIFLIYCW